MHLVIRKPTDESVPTSACQTWPRPDGNSTCAPSSGCTDHLAEPGCSPANTYGGATAWKERPRVDLRRRCGARRCRAHGGELGMESQCFVVIAMQRPGGEVVSSRRTQPDGVGDRVGQQWMRADLDEGGMALGCGRHRLGELHRFAHVVHPVVRVERDRSSLSSAVDDQRDIGAVGRRSASAVRNSGRIGSMVG